MSRTPSQVSSDIRAKLAITAPGLSLEIGTPERKMVDAVAEAIAESYLDNYITRMNWDIDSLTGSELEAFVAIFGFGRILGRQAVGTVTFKMAGPAPQQIVIPGGTQIYAPTTISDDQVNFATVVPAIIAKGQTTVETPAECLVAGLIGNVTANKIQGFPTEIGVASVNNYDPFTGGVDPETDDDLRERFKETLLRNITGTEDFYEGLCLQHEAVSKVHIIGPQDTYEEQLQIVGGEATSSKSAARFIWPQSAFVSQGLGTDAEVYFVEGVDYSFSQTIPAKITVLNNTSIPEGTVLDVSFDYVQSVSRNDPANGITDKIDVYMNGVEPVPVDMDVIVGSLTFNNTSSSFYYATDWNRDPDWREHVDVGHRFTRLGCVPIIALPSSITVGGTTYVQNVDYVLVRRDDRYINSYQETAGIEWLTATPPAASAHLSLSYSYNRVPELLNAMLKETKPIGSDPLVHQAKYLYYRVYLNVMYTSKYQSVSVDDDIDYALSSFFASLKFGDWLQISDIENVVHNVAGVDNVRVARSTDGVGTNYGVVRVFSDGEEEGFHHQQDFNIRPNELFVLHSVVTRKLSYNTFTV